MGQALPPSASSQQENTPNPGTFTQGQEQRVISPCPLHRQTCSCHQLGAPQAVLPQPLSWVRMEEPGRWQWWPQPASSKLLLLSSWQQSDNQINGLIAPLLVTKLILLSALNKCQAAGSWPRPQEKGHCVWDPVWHSLAVGLQPCLHQGCAPPGTSGGSAQG